MYERDVPVIQKFESQLLHRFLNHGYIPFIHAIDEYIPLRRDDQKRSQTHGADVIDVADNLVRRELRVLIVRRAHIALEKLLLRIGVVGDADLGSRPLAGIAWSLRVPRGVQDSQHRESTLA